MKKDLMNQTKASLVDTILAYRESTKGLEADGAWRGRDSSKRRNTGKIIGDDNPFDPTPLLRFPLVLIWGADHYAQRLPHGRWLAWDKLGAREPWDSYSDVEFAWANRRGAARIFNHVWKGICQGPGKDKNKKRVHPAQKPIELMEWCIQQLKSPETIVDPYMGVGTTGVACMHMGCSFVGIEIERKYFDIACERIDAASRQKQLFL